MRKLHDFESRRELVELDHQIRPQVEEARRTYEMKIATYNVNGVNGRLRVLLEWLAEAGPDVVCLQWNGRTWSDAGGAVLEPVAMGMEGGWTYGAQVSRDAKLTACRSSTSAHAAPRPPLGSAQSVLL